LEAPALLSPYKPRPVTIIRRPVLDVDRPSTRLCVGLMMAV